VSAALAALLLVTPIVPAFVTLTEVIPATRAPATPGHSGSMTRAAPLPPIVFVSRGPRPPGGRGEIPGFGPHGRSIIVGGRLMIRDPGGAVRPLLGAHSLYDVADPAVSWDARSVAFAGTPSPDSAWRLYLVSIDGSNLRPLTFGDLRYGRTAADPERLRRYDDLDPCWIGPSRLVFASTRWPLLSEYGSVPVTNLFVLDLDHPRPRRITTERNGAEEPAYDPASGRIIFSRWWHNRFRASNVEAGGLTTLAARALPADSANLWQLVSFDPARHDTRLAAGDPRRRVASMAYQPAVLPNGAIVAAFARHLGLSPGAGGVGLAIFDRGHRDRALPRALVAPRRLEGPSLASGPVDPYRDAQGLAAPEACSPAVLPDGRIVFAYDPGARGDFGLYVIRADGTGLEPLVDLPGTLELDPAPVVKRAWREHRFDLDLAALDGDRPSSETPGAPARGARSFEFHCLNLFSNAPIDAPIPDAPAPATGLRIRFFAALARPDTVAGDTAVLLREARVSSRGEIDVRGLPVDLPMFEQIVDARGQVLLSAHGPAHVAGFNASAPGERRCIGCHVGHSALPVPASVEAARVFNAAPAARVIASASRRGTAGARGAVDRRIESARAATSWIAANPDRARLELTWPLELQIQRLVLHPLASGADEDVEIEAERRGSVVATRSLALGKGGASSDLAFAPADKIVLRFRREPSSRGPIGLAEIEAIARLP
jgi:hypothetical protein